MKSRFLVFSALVLAGILAGWLLRAWIEPMNKTSHQQITANTTEISQLSDRIALLETELKTEKLHSSELEDDLAVQELAQSEAEKTDTQSRHFEHQTSMPSVNALTQAGIPLATAQAIRELIAQDRMAILNLHDRAEREGWLNSSRYAQALRKHLDPTHGIRAQFGDDVYDRYLYATGRPNRVVASVVYPNSTADAAGIQAGDIILSYASKNIYSMRDLQQATVKGQLGESVLMVLQRNGSSFSITVPRGPLGIELKMKSEKPEDN